MTPDFGVKTRKAFTLVELLVAMTILSLLAVILVQIIGAVSHVWMESEKRVEVFQSGRAILEMIARDLTPAAISSHLQFVLDPPLVPLDAQLAANSSSIFWQAPLLTTAKGSLCEVGYFLSRNDKRGTYQLRRFFVAPDDGRIVSGKGYYQIYDNLPSATNALWVEGMNGEAFMDAGDPLITNPNNSASTVVSDGVIGFWVRCLDVNGDTIPLRESIGVHYNSANYFQASIPGQLMSFKWLDAPVNVGDPEKTARAHLLPQSVEITIVMVDAQTLKRKPSIPQCFPFASSEDIPIAIQKLQKDLNAAHLTGVRTFSTRINLMEASR